MTTSDRTTAFQMSALQHGTARRGVHKIGAKARRRVCDRTIIAGTRVLAAVVIGALAGCGTSAPEPRAPDRKPADAVLKKPAPVQSPGDRESDHAVVEQSAPVSSSSDRELAQAAVKKSAPGSSSSDRDAIEVVAKGYQNALKEGDLKAAEAFLTAKARPEFAKRVQSDRSSGRHLGATYQLGEPAITGDTAQVPVTLREAGQEQKIGLKLRRVDGKWGVFAESVRFVPDDPKSEIVMNFEEPEATVEQLFGAKPDAMVKAFEKDFKDSFDRSTKNTVQGKPAGRDLAVASLESMSREQFDASWKMDLSVKERPAGEVLKELAKAMGRSLETTPIQDRALERRVSLELRGVSRFRAVEEVTRQVGLSPVYPTPTGTFDFSTRTTSYRGTMRLMPRRGVKLVAFAGPFLLEIESIKENVEYATAVLTVKVAGAGLPLVAQSSLDHPDPNTFVVTAAVDAKGRSLLDTASAGSTGAFTGRTVPGEYERTSGVQLKGLLRDVSAIKTLRCKLRIPLPSRVETVRFDALAPGSARKAGDLNVTLKSADKRTTNVNGVRGESQLLTVVFDRKNPDRAEPPKRGKTAQTTYAYLGLTQDRVKFVGHDAKGQPLRTDSFFFQSGPQAVTWNVTVYGPAASLVAKVIAEVSDIGHEFVLEDIPLAFHGSMPERIEPARFAGHDCPVTVEFVALGGKAPFQTAELRVTNHSDKDIRMLGMKFDYLAADGKRLGGWDHVDQWVIPWRPGMPPGENKPIIVSKGTHSVFQASAPFLKDGTKTIAVTMRTVGFADAETWTAPAAPKK